MSTDRSTKLALGVETLRGSDNPARHLTLSFRPQGAVVGKSDVTIKRLIVPVRWH